MDGNARDGCVTLTRQGDRQTTGDVMLARETMPAGELVGGAAVTEQLAAGPAGRLFSS